MLVLDNKGMSKAITLGNYEKEVLQDLHNKLTFLQCLALNEQWSNVRRTLDNSYDSMLSVLVCEQYIVKLLE